MKNFSVLILLILGILGSACQQDMPLENPNTIQEVQFNIGTGEKGMKAGENCYEEADYAVVVLNNKLDEPIILPILNINGVLYTSTLKLEVGEYTLSSFILMSQVGDNPDLQNDLPVSASPEQLSNFGSLVDNPAGEVFIINAFAKSEIAIDVLCFNPAEIEDFGFTWFRMNLFSINEVAFFGDLCSYKFEDYNGSKYGSHPMFDMPAIFEIRLYRDVDLDSNNGYESMVGTFNNYEDENGNPIVDANGDPIYRVDGPNSTIQVPPLKVHYSDSDQIEEKYKLDVYVYQMTFDNAGEPNGFDYVREASWYFYNNMDIMYDGEDINTANSFNAGSDGVYDFIAGPCEVIEFDIDLDDPGDPNDPGDDECEECKDLATLTLEYNGTTSATVSVTEKNKTEIFSKVLSPGEEFTVYGTKDSGKFGENELRMYIDGGMDVAIHVSCSKPVNPGLTFGSFKILDAINTDGSHICPDDGNGGSDDCADCDKVTTLTLKYTGDQAATIKVQEKTKDVIFESMVNPGAEFTVSSSDQGDKFGENELRFMVDGDLNTAIHVSCSDPLGPGLSAGLFLITDAINTDGTHLCEVEDDNGGGGDDFGNETAYAYDDDFSTCFIGIQGLDNARWGWTNEMDGKKKKEYTLKLIAGAGQCDASKGTHVGDVKVKVDKNKVDVKYDMKGDFVLTEVHLYIGDEILPSKNGKYTVSGGQFPYKADNLNDADKYEFKDIEVSDNFYLIAHAAVEKK